MNGALAPVSSCARSAAGPAGRGGAVVVDDAATDCVVFAVPDFPPELEHADARTTSAVSTEETVPPERCTACPSAEPLRTAVGQRNTKERRRFAARHGPEGAAAGDFGASTAWAI